MLRDEHYEAFYRNGILKIKPYAVRIKKIKFLVSDFFLENKIDHLESLTIHLLSNSWIIKTSFLN